MVWEGYGYSGFWKPIQKSSVGVTGVYCLERPLGSVLGCWGSLANVVDVNKRGWKW